MQKPGPHEFLLENRAVRLTLLGACCLALYMSATEGVSWLCPILLFLVGHRAGKARKKVAEYRAWAGAWDRMAGTGTGSRAAARCSRALGWRIGLAVWAVAVAWLYQQPRTADTTTYDIVAASVALMSLIGLKRILPRIWRSTRTAPTAMRTQGKGAPIVTTPLPVPRSSPRASDIELPDYCRGLLAPPRSATTASSTH